MKKAAALITALIILCCAFCSGAGAEQPREDPWLPVKGVTEGNTYENPYFGFGIRLEDWRFLSEEDIEKTLKLETWATGISFDPQLALVPMLAYPPNHLQQFSVQICRVEELALFSYPLYPLLEFGLIFYARTLRDDLAAAYEGSGFKDLDFNINTVRVGQKNLTGIRITSVRQRVPYYEQLILMIKDDCLAIIQLTSRVTDVNGELLEHIYWLEEQRGA